MKVFEPRFPEPFANFEYSPEAARSQILAYMLAAPDLSEPVFGLMTNGVDFRFMKLHQRQQPQPSIQYSMSQSFNLFNPGNELYPVLRILKRLGQIAQAG
jgi:hypothetical protein